MAWSLLIRNGTVIDGSGAPAFRADVAVEGDRIAAVSPELSSRAQREIDATGLYVTPGFIDIHSHSDLFFLGCPSAESKVRQGVTTEVVGMCGFSPAPVHPERASMVEAWMGGMGTRLRVEWKSFGEYLARLRRARPAVNVVQFVGHGALRLAVVGPDNRAPTPDEQKAMEKLLAEALEAGAFGYSTGLVYAPSAYAGTGELIELARSMAGRGGLYFSHIRGEAKMLEEAIREAIAIILDECSVNGERWRTASGVVGWDEVLIATCPRRELEALSLIELARRRGEAPPEAMLNLLAEARAQVSMVIFTMTEANVVKGLAHPHVMIGSDSLGLASGPGPHPGKPHPRMYGTFPRVLGRYVRQERLLSWETAINKMTGMPATKLGLKDRGLIRAGAAADLVVFNPETVKDEATYQDPHRYPSGIPYVIVNGQIVVDNGTMNTLPAGRVLAP